MLKQEVQKKHARVLHDSTQVKEHYKMYKVGKAWLVTGLFTISLGAGIAFGGRQDAYADVTETTEPATSQVAVQQNGSQATEAVIGDNAQTVSSNSSNTQAAAGSTATTPETNHNKSAVSTNTQAPADNSAQAKSSTSSTTEVQAPSDNTAQTKANVNDTQTAANGDDQTSSKQVQTTNLGDVTDESTIDQAKTVAAATYAKTAIPQKITVMSAVNGETQAVTAAVSNATKVYDNKTDTPVNFTVKLSDNLTAPTGWYVTSNKDEYVVPASLGDIDLTKVNQNVGTYDITLSANGLARLNAVQANQKKNLIVSSTDVTAGKLTISKAPIASGAVTVQDTSKLYDNQASTDPTSYKVKLASGLVAPAGWTANNDGTYTITVASGDLNADISSQEAGTYKVTLSAAGLQKLNAINPNYDITSAQIKAGNFQIEDNTKVFVGISRITTTNPALPSTLTVSVPRAEKVPDDWTINYNNTGTDSIIYNVPLNYFDFSQVDTGTIGSHSITLSGSAIDTLNGLNPANMKIATTNIKAGEIVVTADATNVPHRQVSNFGGGFPTSMNNAVLSDGQGTQLTLNFFAADTGKDYQNFTDVVIVPAGMTIADATTTTVNGKTITTYTKSSNPAQSFQQQVQASLAAYAVPNSGFKVIQLSNYKGRQAFAVQWADVNTAGKTDAKALVNIMVDPDVKDVTTVGYGNLQGENDAAILYATDSPNLTDGKYILDYGGAYPSNPEVSTALGLSNLVTLGDTYNGPQWAGHFTIVHTPVQDTYQPTDPAGKPIGNPIKVSGNVGDTYNPLVDLPATITTSDGTKYALDTTSISNVQDFKPSSSDKLISTDTVVPGTTYTPKYKQVIDTSTTQAKISDQTITWGTGTPTTFTVTLPSILKVPSNWTSTGNNTYTIKTADGDLDLSAVKSTVGSYDVRLSNQGMSKLAAANPNYLFDESIAGVGELTVVPLSISVTVKDTADTSLKTVPDIQLGADAKVPGADAGVAGYPTSQLKSVTFNYAQNANNTTGVKSATLVANKTDGTITVTTTYYGNKPQSVSTITKDELGGADAGTGLALQLNDGTMGSGLGFNVTPQITTVQAGTMAALTGIDVVYNQKATATVTYVDDDNGGSVVPDTGTTLNGFVDDEIPYTVTIPENYVAVGTVTNPTTVTLTTDDKDNLTIHLQHEITTGTAQSTRTINYVMDGGDNSKAPENVKQTIDWKTSTDHVTNITTATPQTGYAAVTPKAVEGYSVSPATVTADNPAATTLDKVADSTVTVEYTPNKSTTTIKFAGLPTDKQIADKTITTTTDEAYQFTDIPSVAGYTPNTNELDGIGKPTGETRTVTYKADNNSAKVTYVDDVTGKTVDTDSIEGVTDKTGDYSVKVPANYELAKNQAKTVAYHITPDDTDNITVHLTHAIVSGTKTTNRVINYVIDNPNAESVPQTPKTVTQTITWKTSTDKVTGETVATAAGNAPAVAIQPITGYAAKVNGQTATEVPAFFAGAANADDLKDTTVTVTYTPKTVTANVQVPSNKGNQTVTGVTGLVDNNVQVPVPDLPGYTKDKDNVPATVNPDGTITVDNPTTTGKVTYTPDPQSINVTFVDQDKNVLGTVELTGVSDGTVDYTKAYQKQQDVLNQGYTLKHGNNNGLANAPKSFDHDDKSTPNYVVVLSKINQVDVTVNLVPSDGQGKPISNTTPKKVTGLPGTTVTAPDVPGYTTSTPTVTIPGTRDDNVNVTYTPNPQTIKVHFVDDKGADLGTTTLTGVSDGDVDYKPAYAAQQALLNQGYTLKKGNNNGLVSATKTYDRDDKTTPTYEVVLTKITNVKVSFTITPVLPNGDPVPNSTATTVHDYPGTKVNVPNIQGYTPTTDTVTVPDDRTPGINVKYTPNTVTTNVDVPSNKGPQTVTNVTGKTGDHLTITVPTIPGYTPDKTTVPATVNPDGTITVDGPSAKTGDKGYVTYTANDQVIIVNFTDDKTGKVIGTAVLKGKTDGNVDRGPAIAEEQNLMNMGKYTPKGGLKNELTGLPATFTSQSQTFTVQLTKINDVKVTVNLVPKDGDGNPIPNTTPTTVNDFPGTNITVPEIPGYTPTNTQLTIPPKNGDVPVVYTPNAQSAQVKYVDDNNNGAAVGTPTTLTGVTGGSATWNTDDKPAGYDLADGQAASGSYTFAASDNQDVVIHLTHHITTETITSTRTITFKGNTDVDESKLPSTIVQKVNWTISTDEATGDVTFTPDANSNYQAVPLHSIPSDNADITYVPEFTYVSPLNSVKFTLTKDDLAKLGNPDLGKDSTFLNADETYYYNAIGVGDPVQSMQRNVKYVDDDNNGAAVGTGQTISGPVGNTINWTAVVPANYQLAPNQAGSGSIKLDTNSTDVIVHLVHQTTTAHATSSRVIDFKANDSNVVDESKLPQTATQTINWTIVTDKVTGAVTFTPDKDSYPGMTLGPIAVTDEITYQAEFMQVSPIPASSFTLTPDKENSSADVNKLLAAVANSDFSFLNSKETYYYNAYGIPATGAQGHFKDQVPDAPYANQYTINFVTPNGDVIGHMSFVGNPGDKLNVTPSIPKGYVPTPGKDGNITITDTDEPGKPIVFNVTTPAGQDADGVQVWTKEQVPDAPYANQYTINFVTPNGDVVGTATLVGNPGNKFVITGNVPNGYTLVDGADGVVEISNDQNPAQAISIGVVPNGSSDNGGTTDVPGGSSTGEDTSIPTDNPETTIIGDVPNNTVAIGKTDNNTTTGGKADNGKAVTDKGNGTAQVTGHKANSGTSTGLVQQSSNAEVGQASINSANTNAVSSNTAESKAAILPQTNEQRSSVWAMIGLGLMSLLSLFGFKKREDEK